jgi:hypothetical protein
LISINDSRNSQFEIGNLIVEEERVMNADLSDAPQKGRLHDTAVDMMGGTQFDMMMAAHRQLFERIEALNRAWLAVVQETNKSGSDLALRLIQCKDPAEAQGLCDAWLRDCATRLMSLSRSAFGSWLELQQMALKSARDQDLETPSKTRRAPEDVTPEVGKQIQPPPGKSGTRRAEHVAERVNA